ncbi:predicted protein [Naegleria gruberi]|uniref:Predicted protein n=1 Tax=Naegleria gruberi TaxID=5762 RepID=D2VHA5_NAEGR|nr:uncharacterized protein NAEGRDRAFT_34059 [Naegleria gruberi]EFC43767.1 predicted protein [Naegleria gruberi]|eukprot:XP_002676511.1 predicted protein [Naegleria gruberi strain NEG-M]
MSTSATVAAIPSSPSAASDVLLYTTLEAESPNNTNPNDHNTIDPSYNYPIWIPWAICGVLFFVIFIITSIAVCLFQDRREKSFIALVTSIVGISLVVFSIFVVPVDIFNVSQTFDPKENSLVIKILYYSIYLILLIFGSVIIPFAYFWYEEDPKLGENEDDDDKLFHTIKFTLFTFIAGILIIIMGLVMSAISGTVADKNSVTDWLKQLVDVEHFGDRAIRFIVGCLAVVGCFGFNIYTAYGLSALPIGLMKRKYLTYKDENVVDRRADEVDEEIDLLQKKYRMKGTSMNREDQKKYDRLRQEKTELENTSIRIERSKKSIIAKLEPCMYPFKLLIGFGILVVIIFLLISLLINLIYRTVTSKCGIACGFVTEENCYFNPLDLLLTYSSIIFPIDYIILALIICLFIWASMVSLSTIGLRFLCVKLYKLKVRSTVPQGLLTSGIFLMFIMLATSFMLPSFAPVYTTFGSQKYQDSTGAWKQCALAAFNFTEHKLSQNVNSVTIGVPVFSIIFYFENWLFVLCFIIGFIVSIFKKPASFEEADTYDHDEEIMKRPLRGRSYKEYATSSTRSSMSLNSYNAIN